MKKVSFMTLLLTVLMQLAFANSNSIQKPLPSTMKFSPLAETFTESLIVPVSIGVYIPCADESVSLEGNLHSLFTYTINQNRLVIKTIVNPQGISGTGTVSGDKYQGTGMTQETTTGSLVNGQFSDTFVNSFRIIGQRTGNNFLVSSTFHITINADGTLTAVVDNFTVECK